MAKQQKKSSDATGTIYFVASAGIEKEYFKIGYTKDFAKRLAVIQYGVPFEVSVIATIEGTYKDERRLHRQLRQFRLRGEWYSLPNKIAWGVLESFGRKVLPMEAFGCTGQAEICYLRYQLKPPDESLLPVSP